MKIHRLLALGMLLFSVANRAVGADIMISGTVLDLASPNASPKGIPGVEILIKTYFGAEVARGVTDAKGGYRLKVEEKNKPPLVAEFRKIKYFEDPTTMVMKDLSNPQKVVYMAESGKDSDYYTGVARSIIGTADPLSRRERLAVVAALPSSDVAMVSETLNVEANQAVLRDLQAEYEHRLALTSVREQFGRKFSGMSIAPVKTDDGGQSWLLYGTVAKDQSEQLKSTVRQEIEKHALKVDAVFRSNRPGEEPWEIRGGRPIAEAKK